ncbi:hypothetical protein [Candidatus Coxiella mudrowiae]|nr:hypothetical protein [Candidatus Coxiella mudrowiae]
MYEAWSAGGAGRIKPLLIAIEGGIGGIQAQQITNFPSICSYMGKFSVNI